MMRLFIGIALPLHIRQQLHTLQLSLIGLRCTHIEDYHLTLSFIGEVDERMAEEIDETVAGIRMPDFDLTLKGTGYFSGGKHSSHLWIGVTPSEALQRLKEKIDRALDARHFPYEKRKYTPHITIAKLKHSDDKRAALFMQENNLFATPSFHVDEFTLYQSHLGTEGPLYEELRTYPLF